jgi:preprotein translocase subunit SecG
MQPLLLVLLVLSSLTVIVLVLIQHGKGADMGAAFGGGSSGSLFGASGSANFLSRSTAIAATVFFLATIGLAFTATSSRTSGVAPKDATGVVPIEAKKDAPKDIPAAPTAAPAAPDNSKKGSDVPK